MAVVIKQFKCVEEAGVVSGLFFFFSASFDRLSDAGLQSVFSSSFKPIPELTSLNPRNYNVT
jgi:hypothetical protein